VLYDIGVNIGRRLGVSFARRLTEWFAQETIYPGWISSFMNEQGFANFQATGTELLVGVGRLPRHTPKTLGISLGILAYFYDKYGVSKLHPELADLFGLQLELRSLRATADATSASHLLVCAASAPPFLPAQLLDDNWAVDGGFADNAPRLPLTEQDNQQMMLLTRHYPSRPPMFRHCGRTYMQPSKPIPVSTWDSTTKTDIFPAFELGRRDGVAALKGHGRRHQ
jgi:hypothetical protein